VAGPYNLGYFLRVSSRLPSQGVIVKIRKSKSLVAAGCTVCIAVASGAVTPQAAAAALPKPPAPVVSKDVALRASVDPFVIASLPLQNFITTYSALAAVAGGVINPLNTASGAFATGDIAGVTTALNSIPTKEAIAIGNLLDLPAQLIETDLAAIGFMQSALTSAKTFATADSAADVSPAAVDPVAGLLAVASLPLQNFISIYSALAAVAAGVINPLNTAWGAFAAGNIPGITTALNSIVPTETAAIGDLLGLPAKIIAQDIATIAGAFGFGAATQQTALSATPFAADSTADASAAAVDPVAGLLAVASLPLQNFIATYSAGADVVAGVINPINTAWGAFAAGNIPGVTMALSGIAANEAVAIGNLLGLPAKIIAHDVATIVGAFGGGTAVQSVDAGATALSAKVDSSEGDAAGDENGQNGDDSSAGLGSHQGHAGQSDDQTTVDAGDDGTDTSTGSDKQDPDVGKTDPDAGKADADAGKSDPDAGKSDPGAGTQDQSGDDTKGGDATKGGDVNNGGDATKGGDGHKGDHGPKKKDAEHPKAKAGGE
jgi:hypothetical protein